jgi:hypothetical protein
MARGRKHSTDHGRKIYLNTRGEGISYTQGTEVVVSEELEQVFCYFENEITSLHRELREVRMRLETEQSKRDADRALFEFFVGGPYALALLKERFRLCRIEAVELAKHRGPMQ